jgi:hypothetical protein
MVEINVTPSLQEVLFLWGDQSQSLALTAAHPDYQ